MILSVSRRTDIPAFYETWFLNRLRAGHVLVRNPMNYHQVSKVSLDPSVIDCIVFWTKNAAPLIPDLDEIRTGYPFYFQYTLNGYGKDIEPHLPDISQKTETFRTISQIAGPRYTIWRYDPILLTDIYTVDWHTDTFRCIAENLKGYTTECVFSFIDIYDKIKSNINELGVRGCTADEADHLAAAFADIAKQNGFRLRTCAESVDLARYGIEHGCCIDGDLISELTGWNIAAKKDPNQRLECGCLESIDIGQYNTCRHGCRYCYANFNPQSVVTFSCQHDPLSPFLIGNIGKDDKITERKMKSLKKEPAGQLSMFQYITSDKTVP